MGVILMTFLQTTDVLTDSYVMFLNTSSGLQMNNYSQMFTMHGDEGKIKTK